MNASRRSRSSFPSLAVVLFVLAAAGVTGAQLDVGVTDVLVPRHATWSYLDDGSDQGTAWQAPGFDDTAWATGQAHFGYGDDDEATVVSFGPNGSAKYTTTYFRHDFEVVDPSFYSTVRLKLIRDDGAVVYLNGVEVFRSNMAPTGPIAFDTFALAAQSGSDEDQWRTLELATTDLVAGTNTFAVEVHQNNLSSSDLSFDLELVGTEHEMVHRGPFLQIGTPTSVVVRWETVQITDGRVWYGTDPGNLNLIADDVNLGVVHEVTLTGLLPGTTYHYAVGTTSQALVGADGLHRIVTAPPVGSAAPVRIWATGDAGTADSLAESVRDAYLAYTGATHTDVWLMLGDNAYDDGFYLEYQSALFEMYPQILAGTVLWPTRGNHENSLFQYWSQFTLPKAAEAGGMASGTESYYSFDHANIHFICLDSDGSSKAVGGAMWSWLESDLISTDQEWIIAYWHHPPYTRGSHNSNTESDLVEMRERFVPLLESHGVDLVLCGHSHSYERSYLLDGHYDVEATFDDAMKVDGGSGQVGGDGAYEKLPGPHAGAVYVVAGSAGKITGTGPLTHPAMFHSVKTLGSVVIDVNGTTLDATFLDATGAVEDFFTIVHEPSPWTDLGFALAGTQGDPALVAGGSLVAGEQVNVTFAHSVPSGVTNLIIGVSQWLAPFKGGVLVPSADLVVPLPLDAQGRFELAATWPPGIPSGFVTTYQAWTQDPAAIHNWAATNAVTGTTP